MSMLSNEGSLLDNTTSSENEEDEEAPAIKSSRPSVIGRIRTFNNVKVIEWNFIFISVVTIGVGFGFTLYRMSTIPPNSDQFVFAILVLVNLLFATFYLFHGIFQEQPFEVLMYIFTTLLLGSLVTINFASTEIEEYNFKLIRFVVTMVLSLPNILIGCTLGWQYWISGALIFKTVGGDMRLQSMCRTYFLGLSLLVFDAQALISCVILVMEHGVTGMTNEEIVILVVGAAFTVSWLSIGYTGMRMENIRVTWLFVCISIVQPLYVLYLFIKGFEQYVGPYSIRTESSFLAGAILVVAHFTLLSTLCAISYNYGKGLKVAIYGSDSSLAEIPQRPGASSIEEGEGDDDVQPLISSRSPSQNPSYETITPASVQSVESTGLR